MKVLLSAKKLNKSYGDLKVLNDVTIEVAEEEIVAIIGPSGAGKTTLLHILGTLDHPDSNPGSSLTLDGVDTTQLNEKAIAKFRNGHMGFIFQFHELLPEFTALENVCLPTWLSNKTSADSQDKALELLKRLGVINRAHHKPSELSGGEQQRVAVARALINDPKIIFADEPSGNLDSENANQLHDLFFELRKERACSFVIVTHNKELAKRADRTIRLKDGNIH